jgi:DNA ligase (NAD+)
MDIDGLGEQQIASFLELGLMSDVADIYSLRADLILQLPGYQQLSVQNLLSAVEASKSRPLGNLLFGLNILHLGASGGQTLAAAFGSLDAIMSASIDDLSAVSGIGPVIAGSVFSFFSEPANRQLVQRLVDVGVNTVGPERSLLPQTLSNKSVVVTGSLAGFSRDAAGSAIKERGGTSPGSVSKKTFAVVIGEEPGASKLAKATELQIPLLNEADFVQLLQTGELPTTFVDQDV